MKSLALAATILLGACGGAVPQTRYYQLAAPAEPPPATRGDRVLSVETLGTEGAYDDERIVYRTGPYRLDYYQYQRWSSLPGVMVAGFLRQALARTGRFRAVLRETTPDAALVLGGRIIAIEEVDRSKTEWSGRIAVELTLTDPKTGDTVWAQSFDETEPLAKQSPEGLATALSAAMTRIVSSATPVIAEIATKKDAVASGKN